MATQTDVQQLIQSLVPSGVNNGNPNTVYNVPPPSLNAQGQWAQGLLPQAASIGGLNLPAILAQLPQSNWGGGPSAGAPAGPLLPSFPAPAVGGGGGGGGAGGGSGGFTPPNMSTPTPPTPVGGGGTGGVYESLFEPIRDVHTGILQQGQTLPGSWTDPYTGGFGTVGPWAGMTGGLGGGGGGGHMYSGASMAPFWQGASGFGGKLMEFLDKLSEPALPGDMVQQGKFNSRQAGMSAIQALLGFDPGQLAGLAGKGDQYNKWIADGFGQLQGNMAFSNNPDWNSQGFNMGQINPFTQQVMHGDGSGSLTSLLQQLNQQAQAPTEFDTQAALEAAFGSEFKPVTPKMTGGGRDSRSAAGAGSTVIAEEAVAQQMVADWQAAQREALMKALAQGAMNPRHSLES